ncbi:tet methylcytosine dioxygenase 1 [Cricetulus griseus]
MLSDDSCGRTRRRDLLPRAAPAMPRSSNAKPSKSVRIDLHKKEISLKKTLKQSAKHKLSGKMNSGKLKELIQRRDVKKETEDKTSTPSRSLLTRAGAARMNEDSTQDLFQNPESLTCKGFTMALRRTSLSRRLSQCPVVTSKPKKAPPSKSVSKPQCNPNTQDDKVERSENDSVPSQDPIMSPDTENLIDEESLCLVEDEIQEITQSWPQRVEESQRCPSTYESPATDMLSGPPEGTLCEGLLSPQTSGDVNTSPQDCAPLPQGSTPEVTPQKNTSNQVEDLGSQVESLKLPEPSPIPIGNGHNCFPTSSFKMLPELDLKNCMSLDGSIYPTALIKFLLAGSQPDILGAKPQEEETLKTNPDQGGCCPDQFLDATSVLGQAFGTFPPQWELPGANLVPGEVLDKVSDSPDLGAITLVNQQETLNVDMGTSSDLPIFLPNPSNTVATYSTLPPGPEPHNYASCGLEVQGAIPILTLDSGFAPQPPPNSELSSIPPVIATNSIQDKKQLCANPSPANTQGFTIASENGLQNAPLDLTRGSQTAPSKLEGGMISQVNMPSSADVKTTGMSTPVTQASASSLSHKPTSPTVEKKKRKPCGVCEPCQQKTNCGECTYCKNRKNSHQICKKRKCEVLKKRPDATSGVQRDDNKSVNGPKPESMAYSQCGHGEEGHRLDWIAHPLENVGKNTKSMTAIEVGQWTPTKRAHFSGQVKGDLDANLTEVVSSQSFEEDRQETKPSPMFAQTMRNVIKNVHCLPADTNLLINKLDLQEISKVLGNTSKFPTNSANCKDVMSSITADGCDQLKDTNNIFLFQKPDLNCQSGVNSTNFNHPTTHSAASQPQTPDKVHSKEPKEDSPVQPSLLSIIKDRRLTLEQVVAIEALTQLSEAPSENSSPSKSEKDEKTDQTTASLLHSCKALLNYVRKDLQDPNSQGKCLQHPDTVVFNGQITTIKLLDSSATNQELENSCGHANTLKEGRKCIAGGKLTIVKDAHYTEIEEDVAAQLTQLASHVNLTTAEQIEEDVAAQLTQLASHINLTTAESKNAECPLGSLVSKTIQEKGIVQQKPPSDILTKPSIPIAKPKNKTRKKAKTTPKTDKPKKEPLVSLSSQENDKQEQFATKYSKMHDIWMSCKFQRFGQSGPHDVPLLLGNIPTFEEILTPVVHSRDILGLKNNTLFPPVSQIQFRRYSESAKEEVKVEPQESLPSCQFKTESSRQVFADLADRAQVEPRENISEKAQPLPQPSPPSNQCANMPGADKTQFHLCAQENLVHQIPPSLPGTSPDTPFPELLSILSKDNVTNSNGITLGMAKWELQTPSNGPLGDSITHSAQTDFNETIRNCLREPATLLLPGANEEKDSVLEGPPCDCKDQTDKGPYYTHLGAGPSVAAIRELMETRYCEKGKAIRIEKIEYMGKESKSSRGCPVVKTVKYEDVAADCRLGTKKGRPFSGVTCCMDFCAHSHKDNHNMINGSTVVLTLLRKDARDRNNLQDEQFHVLPLHRLADTDEFGSREGMEAKIRSGAIEIIKPSVKKLLHFNEPIPRCGKRRTTMKEHNKNPAADEVKKKRNSSNSLVDAEPVTSPSEHPQLPFLSCPRELEHCAADEPLSDDLSSDEIIITQTEFLSDSEEIYYDPCFGGVAIALTHGSVLIEYARGELHATTPLTIPNRSYPIRTSLVLYQHKNMNVPNHGFDLCRIKCKPRDLRKKKPVDPEGPDLSIEANLLRTIPSRIASTLTHDNVVTVSPYAFTHIAGPYNHWV